jgi:hypothetical protein
MYFLCLTGLLGYVFVRSLATLVQAGSPYYEWLLYLWFALLAIAWPAYASFRVTKSRLGLVAGLALAFLTLVCGVYLDAVFLTTPLRRLTLLGLGLTAFSLHALVTLLIGSRHVDRWFAGKAERVALLGLAGFTVLAVVSWGGFSIQRFVGCAKVKGRLSFWGGWDASTLSHEVLSDLRDIDATLYIFTGEKVLDDTMRDGFREAMERYAEYDIDVLLASILASNDGYVSIENLRQYADFTEGLLAFVRKEDLHAVRGVIADSEPPYSIVDPWVKETAVTWLQNENRRYRRWDAEKLEQALLQQSTFIDRFHGLYPGLHLMVSTIQLAIYDALDGDADLSIAYKFVAYPPRNWDGVNVQVYSSRTSHGSAYFTWQGVRLSQHVVKDAPLSVSIGIIGDGRMQGQTGFRRLVEDIHLCRALGVEEVIVFTLARGLEAFGPDFVPRLHEAASAPACPTVGFSRAGALTPYWVSMWDTVLDLRGQRFWIVAGWWLLVFAGRALHLPALAQH